ncbi:hypothetical protein [Pedobacter sp. GR22-6]|uniref:hypothetical protein n=1 Tax=Pedobacter sp. GR22-6 TaxID=3127957 RepID=UPI00307F7618
MGFTEADVQVLFSTYKAAFSGTILRHLNGNMVSCERILSSALFQMKKEKAEYKSEQCTGYVWMLRIVMRQINAFQDQQ